MFFLGIHKFERETSGNSEDPAAGLQRMPLAPLHTLLVRHVPTAQLQARLLQANGLPW